MATAVARRRHRETSPATFPEKLVLSNFPSPVMSTCARRAKVRQPTAVMMNAQPLTSWAPAKAERPKAVAPAAPAPGKLFVCRCAKVDKCFIARSSTRTSAAEAPFCGPKVRADPRGPNRGFETSHRTIIFVRRSRGSSVELSMLASSRRDNGLVARGRFPRPKNPRPNAASAPAPPSAVAVPPTPRSIERHPASNAAEISSPVPREVASITRFFPRVSARPDARAISITAVGPRRPRTPETNPHSATTGRPKGPVTRVRRRLPRNALMRTSRVPSPPSASGNKVTDRKEDLMPRAMACAAWSGESVPLKAVGQTRAERRLVGEVLAKTGERLNRERGRGDGR